MSTSNAYLAAVSSSSKEPCIFIPYPDDLNLLGVSGGPCGN